jgi:hypothetical protein
MIIHSGFYGDIGVYIEINYKVRAREFYRKSPISVIVYQTGKQLSVY